MAARRLKEAVLSGPCAQTMSAEKQVRVQNVHMRGGMPRCLTPSVSSWWSAAAGGRRGGGSADDRGADTGQLSALTLK